MKVVVPVMPKSLSEIKAIHPDDYKGADIIEWRADFLPFDDILSLAPIMLEKFSDFELLFTFRTAKEGGEQAISDEKYTELLKKISEFKLNYIDLEYFSYPQALAELTAIRDKLVLSYHNFSEMPGDLSEKLFQMEEENTAYVKVAIMPNSECNVIDLMQITRDFTLEYGSRFIILAMGALGKVTRVSGSLTGSIWTFASLEKASAPGQLSLSETRKLLETFKIAD